MGTMEGQGPATVQMRKSVKIGRPGYKVVKQRDPTTGQRSLLFEVSYPEIEKGFQPRHRFMSAFEQRVERPDTKYQCVARPTPQRRTAGSRHPSLSSPPPPLSPLPFSGTFCSLPSRTRRSRSRCPTSASTRARASSTRTGTRTTRSSQCVPASRTHTHPIWPTGAAAHHRAPLPRRAQLQLFFLNQDNVSTHTTSVAAEEPMQESQHIFRA